MRTAALLLAGLCSTILAQAHPRAIRMVATAFSLRGVTSDGSRTHRGIVAADPAVLPLGSRILIRGAGRYSGYYVVRDTGSKIRGLKIDLFIPNIAAARKFGRKMVSVLVISRVPAG